jgi:predicted alpha/beta hydrolase
MTGTNVTETLNETLAITSPDGARVDASVFPAAESVAPVVMIWPAMGTPARFYQRFAEALAVHGINAVTVDLRGIGSSSVRAARGVDFGYRQMLEQDWSAAVAAVRLRFPQAPLWLLGHSLGGQLSALYLAQNPAAVSGLLLVASGSVYYRGWNMPKRWGLLAFTQFAAALSSVLGYFPGKRVGFGGTEARGVMRDWARVARNGRYRPDGASLDYEAALAGLRVPVLGISFADDDFAPHPAMRNLLEKMPAAATTHLRLSAEDTGSRFNHFSWVKQPESVVPRITGWLKTVTGAQS